MPTYDYICNDCGHELEAFQRMSDDPLKDCPACGKPSLKRLIGTGAGIIFKGGGFYETDYKRKDSNGGDSGSSESKSSNDSKKSESKKSDSTKSSSD